MDTNSIFEDLVAFGGSYETKLESWRRKLRDLHAQGCTAVVWGAGSKGVTFLNAVQAGDAVRYVVDLNPRKHGRFVAGTGQEIVPPEFLKQHRPDVVILMNRIYEKEVRELVSSLDLHPDFLFA
jgi:hypothetical protein